MRTAIEMTYRVLYALLGLVAVVLSALIQFKIVGWDRRIAAAVAIGVGALACIDNIRLIKVKFDAKDRSAARSRMYKPVVSALSSITLVRSVRLDDLGISVFGIHRYWGRRWGLLPWPEERLRRLLRFRVSDYPPESAVNWTRGKGAVGECWAKGIRILDNRLAVALAFGDPQVATPATYEALTDQQRYGLAYPEFRQTVGKYGEILATPIQAKHSGETIGVLAIDCSAGVYQADPSVSVLAGSDIEEFAQRAANLIRDDVAGF